ncbi:phage tail tape measure protein [Gordonia sp. N1V]|uniref:phage tail tape measure protein n=1 Tax=Gordonia sp. N1V TaxID=3034163 RepID=UPI0023E0A234|nr:phage tail tape measure protein [Gordonia sp. N1V]MDF3280926.1 phage tail tape measure protein [Gordonia sp. N1V]
MTESGSGIFLDLVPAFDMRALEKIFSDITSRATSLGGDLERRLGNTAGTAAAEKAQASLARSQAAVEAATNSAAAASDKATAAAGRYEVAMARLRETTDRYAAGSSQAIAAENRLEAARTANTRAAAALADANRGLTSAQLEQSRAADASAVASRTAAGSHAALGTAMKVGAAATATFAVGMGLAVHSAADFQQSQERLVTSAGEQQSALQGVSDGLIKMAGDVGYSTGELSKGMYTVESAGFHGADGLKVMTSAAQGAKAENADLTETTDAVTTALHDYHLGADQAGTVMSKMVTAVSQGKTTLQAFAGSLHSVQPLAAQAGISINDLYGSLAQMTSSGMSADQATQNMADAIRHLQNPTSGMTAELSQVGISSQQLSRDLGKQGLSGSMEEISTAIMSNMGPSGQVMLNTFNQSKIAAQDASKMMDALGPAAQKLAQEFSSGEIGMTAFRKGIGGLSADQAGLARQWLSTYQTAHGFNNMLKAGGSDVQTYASALAKATGDSSSMNVALQLTGENYAKTSANVKLVSQSTTEADGTVKGFHEAMGTLNGQLSRTKDGLQAAAVSAGSTFLPAVTSVVKVVADASEWLAKNKIALDILVGAIGAAAGAYLVFKTVSGIMKLNELAINGVTTAMGFFTASEEAATVAATEMDVALDANPLGAIVLAIEAVIAAIVALGVGLYEMYKHWTPFRNIVNEIWDGLKTFAGWIATGFMAAWHGIEDGIRVAVGWFETFWHGVQAAWTAIQPVIHGIELGVRVVGAVIATVIGVAALLAFKFLAAGVKMLYDSIIHPVFEAWGAIVHWLYNSVIKPVFDFISSAWHWLAESVIRPVVEGIKLEIQGFGIVVHWLYDNVIQPVMHLIGDVWNWLYNNVIQPVVEGIKVEIQEWGKIFQWVYDSVIKPVGSAIGDVLSGIKDAFKGAVDWVEQQWDRIVDIVKTPAKFVIDTVYNDAVVPVWNHVAGVFGLHTIDKVGLPQGFAGGGIVPFAGGGVHSGPGVLPGYSPGVDSIPAVLSPGESVLTPEATRMLGHDFILGINAMSGRPSANSQMGGPVHAAGGFLGSLWGDAKSMVSGAWGDVTDAADLMSKMVSDPGGAIKKMFEKVIGLTKQTPGDASQWKSAITGIPGKIIDGAVDLVKKWFSDHPEAGHDSPVAGARAVQAWRDMAMKALAKEGYNPPSAFIDAMLAQIATESGGNPSIIQQVHDVNSGGNEAAGILQVTPGTFAKFRDPSDPNNRLDPMANMDAALRYVRAQYGGDINGVWGHGHGYAGGGIVPMYFAGGGTTDDGSGGTTTVKSGPEVAIDTLKQHSSTPYDYGGGSWSGLDCSGLVAFGTDIAEGKSPARIGTTTSLMAGGWPGMIKGASQSDALIVGTNADHMAMSILGTNFEERTSGETMRVGSDAVSPFDHEFTEQWHLDPKLFSPPFDAAKYYADNASTNTMSPSTGEGTTGTITLTSEDQQKVTDLQNKVKAANDAADKDTADAKAADAAVAKATADAQVATEHAKTAKSDAVRQQYQAAANKALAQADQQRAAAKKYRDDATTQQSNAKKYQNQITQLQNGSSTNTSTPSTNSDDSSSGGTGSLMTAEQFGQQVGGIAADGLFETFGLTDFEDPNQFAVIKVPGVIAQSVIAGQSRKPNANDEKNSQLARKGVTSDDTTDSNGKKTKRAAVSIFDDGGWLMPDELALNKSNRPEPILNFEDKRKLDSLAYSEGAGPKATVLIENMHNHGADGRQVARDIYREMSAHQGGGTR